MSVRGGPTVSLPSPNRSKSTGQSPSPELNVTRLLACIAEVETGQKDWKIGRSGERSQYQIKPIVWNTYRPRVPFVKCCGAEAAAVAREHIHYLIMTMATYPSALKLGIYWNCGLGARVLNISYGKRVQNLYNDPTFLT